MDDATTILNLKKCIANLVDSTHGSVKDNNSGRIQATIMAEFNVSDVMADMIIAATNEIADSGDWEF